MFADRAPADVTEQRRANFLGWTAGITVAVSFGFMVWNYLQNAPDSGWLRPSVFGFRFAAQFGSILFHFVVAR
jgi:hypothetical protein